MKTVSANAQTVKRDWFVVDASDKTLGRLCTELAHRLRGKHKPTYTPHVDTGDFLVVINAEKIAVTGKKLKEKMYHRFTGYVGNLKTESLAQALERHPERVIEIHGLGVVEDHGEGVVTLEVRCSAGTYVRRLAADIGGTRQRQGHVD